MAAVAVDDGADCGESVTDGSAVVEAVGYDGVVVAVVVAVAADGGVMANVGLSSDLGFGLLCDYNCSG